MTTSARASLASPHGLASLLMLVLFVAFCGQVAAAGTYADFLAALAAKESDGKPGVVNAFGYAGLYQMGEAALIDAGYYKADASPGKNDWAGTWTGKNGINSLADFLSDPAKQNQAVTDYHQKLWSSIQSTGLGSYVGKTVGGIPITESSLIAGAHLVGPGGLQNFLTSGGAIVPKDGNGTPITDYISTFGGYAVSAIAPPWSSGPSATSPSSGSTATLPVAPLSIPVPPATAFFLTTGATPANVKLAVGMLITTLLFLWVVWTSVSHFNSWRKGQLAMINLQWDLTRALMVLMVLIAIVQ